jgi:hypothetical protein
MNKNRNYYQKGGLGFGDAIKAALLSSHPTGNITDIDIIRLLLSNVIEFSVLSDMSTYSYVLLCKMMTYKLVDTYGKPLSDTVDTPGLDNKGKQVDRFCVKISFSHPSKKELSKYPQDDSFFSNQIIKGVVSPTKVQKECEIQKRLWEQFSCIKSTSPFVPFIIACSFLTLKQFDEMFKRILLFTVDAPTHPQVRYNMANNGTIGSSPDAIYSYIRNELLIDPNTHVHVMFMEMMNEKKQFELQTELPPLFRPLHTFIKQPVVHGIFSRMVAAQIVLVGAAKIATHDIHGYNVLVAASFSHYGEYVDSEIYIIDWGGILDLSDETYITILKEHFHSLCHNSANSPEEATLNSRGLIDAISMSEVDPTIETKLMKNGYSIQELCGFFGLKLTTDGKTTNERNSIIPELERLFEEEIEHCFGPIRVLVNTQDVQEDVHRRLMMIAFIDFMYNRLNNEYPFCQCGEILEDVYPVHKGPNTTAVGITISTFKDLRSFLNMFSLAKLPKQHCLDEVVDHIIRIREPCSSKTKVLPKQLTPNWSKIMLDYKNKKPKKTTHPSPRISSKRSRPVDNPPQSNMSRPDDELSSPAFHHTEPSPRFWNKWLRWPWSNTKGGTRKITSIRNIRIRKSRRNRKYSKMYH